MVLQGPTTNDSTIWYEVQGVSLTGWIAGNLLVEPGSESGSLRSAPDGNTGCHDAPGRGHATARRRGRAAGRRSRLGGGPVEVPVENGRDRR